MRAATFSTPNISRATRAEMMFELSPLDTAAKAPASSMPASRRVSWSKPIPVTRRPPNPGPRRRKAVGSWSITATVCPCCSRVWARAEPTLPQPMMTMCTTVLPVS